MTFTKLFTCLSVAAIAGFLLLLLAAGFFAKTYFHSFSAKEIVANESLLEIPYGTSLRLVSKILERHGVIDDAEKFYWYMRIGRSDGGRVQAGFYKFSGLLSPKVIADRLLFGRDQSYAVIFKEGQTLVDLAATLQEQGLVKRQEFTEAMTSDEILSLINAPGSRLRQTLENDVGGIEGYLYPDTYFFTKKDSATQIIRKMHQRLKDLLDDKILARMRQLNKSLHEVLTLASIIEKETADARERTVISSVYNNRLTIGMRLQADPTVIYGMKNYQGKIGKADLLAYHPYNTYKISGLPPGPISSVGLPSIKAALWPLESKFRYFVSKNDGTHVFCEDLGCHNTAVKKWQIDYFKQATRH